MLDLVLAILAALAGFLIVGLGLLALLSFAGAVFAGNALERLADLLIPGRKTGLGPQAVIGAEARVVRSFSRRPQSDEMEGMVQVGGELWTARSSTELAVGARVRVSAVEGLTVFVEPIGGPGPQRS